MVVSAAYVTIGYVLSTRSTAAVSIEACAGAADDASSAAAAADAGARRRRAAVALALAAVAADVAGAARRPLVWLATAHEGPCDEARRGGHVVQELQRSEVVPRVALGRGVPGHLPTENLRGHVVAGAAAIVVSVGRDRAAGCAVCCQRDRRHKAVAIVPR